MSLIKGNTGIPRRNSGIELVNEGFQLVLRHDGEHECVKDWAEARRQCESHGVLVNLLADGIGTVRKTQAVAPVAVDIRVQSKIDVREQDVIGSEWHPVRPTDPLA